MKLISTRDLKLKTADVWGQLEKEGELVVTSHGKPVALLTSIPEGDFEPTLVAHRRAREQMAISSIRQGAQERGLDQMTMKEIDDEVKASRKSSSKTRSKPRRKS
ncbi:MAG: type II toxin-antitoxin system Phd/YefM family antitoxin [Thermoleophilia bacterium]|nr:type II toxin-antitoxin system Phd/YefM family antitoxin [Thermoleophilia bacterium]